MSFAGGMRRLRAALLGVPLTVLLVACGSHSSLLEGNDPTGAARGPAPRPAAREMDRDAVEALLREAQRTVDRLRREPGALEDAGGMEALAARHTSGSPRVASLMNELEELASEGQRHRPRESLEETQVLIFDAAAIDRETVAFEYCTAMDVQIVGDGGDVVEPVARSEVGAGEIRWEAGAWRLHDLRPWQPIQLTPGLVHARECELYDLDDLVPPQEREGGISGSG